MAWDFTTKFGGIWKFLTLNGQDIDENLPAVRELYTRINKVVNAATGKIYQPGRRRQSPTAGSHRT